ncbi:MAG: hypothetical protein Athens101410_78 [Parcubacteria group bacterium Athens1014_10]|nr:MAG: hypothetical protein Athens101410_78 [Parcubacteria group bacterium Athens1014_10]TSD06104.1 MAG: hypothetical protein Athens071412_78 [Parcubacteria group bacterium Athens0714_12]
MAIYGFDIDGVISKGFSFFGRNFELMVYQILRVRFFRKIYDKFFRKVDAGVRKTIARLKSQGNKIVIISANSENYREELESWLKWNGVIFDKLILRENMKESCQEYKGRMAQKERCVYYLEDRRRIVDYINENSNCQAILYKN